jgi:hypothetical protein
MKRISAFLRIVLLLSCLVFVNPVRADDSALSDLQPAQISVTTLYTGVDNTLSITVNNNSNVAVGSFKVLLEADGTEIASTDGNYISGNQDAYYWPSSLNFKWKPQHPGEYTLKAIVDPDNRTAESDETNNEITLDVKVIELTDITVKIRIESKTSTIWNGSVTFNNSTITDKQGDIYTVDHPTVLGALEEAAKEGNFNFVVSSIYGPLLYLESIAGDKIQGSYGWLYQVNWQSPAVAAVDYTLADNDEILWYYGGWAAQPLKLTVDKTSLLSGDKFTIRVETFNGTTGLPVKNARVYLGSRIYTTDEAGLIADISLPVGKYTFRAEKSTYESYIRSNPSEIVVSVPLEVQPGWNFVSIPKRLISDSAEIESLFGQIDTAGHSIFSYEPEKGWQALKPGDILSPLDGIWIYSTQSVVLYPEFDPDPLQVPLTKKLARGWNAIGFAEFNATSANTALTSVEAEWAYLIGFDPLNQTYEVSIVNNAPESEPHSEYRLLETWKGYWIYMTSDGELAALNN